MKDHRITLPPLAQKELRDAFGEELDRVALEAIVIEGYRLGRLSLAQVRRLLGIDNRWDTEKWLGDRGVTWNYDREDLEADRQVVREVSGDST